MHYDLGHRFKTTYDFGFVALDILYAYPEDSGTYMCKAKNLVGEAVTTCVVSVDCEYFITIFSLLSYFNNWLGIVIEINVYTFYFNPISTAYNIQTQAKKRKRKMKIDSSMFSSLVNCLSKSTDFLQTVFKLIT